MSGVDERNVKEGMLQWKLAHKTTRLRERYCVLRDSHLFFTRNAQEVGKVKFDKRKVAKKECLNLKGCEVRNITSGVPNGFHVQIKDGEAHVFAAADEESRTDWVELFKEASLGLELTREIADITSRLRRAGHDIPDKDLEFDSSGSEVGRGASGIVRKGTWLGSTPVAVKALGNLPEFTDPKELVQFYKEIEILSKLRSPYVVQMFGFSKKDGFLCLVTEFVGGGTLSMCLEKPYNFVDDALRVEIAMNICRGMVFLHNMGLIHRDLKPANVLIESWNDGKLKICDFGLSTIATKKAEAPSPGPEDGEPEVVFGSPQYAAPELSKEDHTNKVDVFSYAIILWQIDTRQLPWDEITFPSQYAERYEQGKRPIISPTCCYKQLVTLCWAQDPSARPSFKEIYEILEGIQKTRRLNLSAPERLAQLAQFEQGVKSDPTLAQSPATKRLPGTLGRRPSQGVINGGVPGGISMTSQGSMTNMRPTGGFGGGSPAAAGDVESMVYEMFGGSSAVAWRDFAPGFCRIFGNLPMQAIEPMQYLILDDAGQTTVLRSKLERLFGWFNPLSVAKSAPGIRNLDTGGYSFDMMIEVVAPTYFHGHLSPDQAQALLRDQPEGTYLFRFSSTPGAYTLSVAYHNVVGHWRIQCQKKLGDQPKYLIENREYRSLQHIIQIHNPSGESLKVTRVAQGQPATCFLRHPMPRDGSNNEDLYHA